MMYKSPVMSPKDKLYAYMQLTRFDKPVGIELLLWPTLWGVMLAAMGQAQQQGATAGLPSLKVFVIFALGAILMRAAGCAINDFADRKVDGHVTRTKGRPLADGRLSGKEAIAAFLVLVLLSASLLFFLPIAVFYWSLGAVILAFIYPFMKRYTHLPQVVLGAAFGWSIPMAFAAVSESVPLSCWLMFLANILWAVAYDTQYAMVDRDDDLKIGIKSTAILFGQNDKLVIGILQVGVLVLMALVGWLNGLGLGYYWSLLVAGALFVYQQKLIVNRERDACFKAFMNNNYVGLVLFLGLAMSYWHF